MNGIIRAFIDLLEIAYAYIVAGIVAVIVGAVSLNWLAPRTEYAPVWSGIAVLFTGVGAVYLLKRGFAWFRAGYPKDAETARGAKSAQSASTLIELVGVFFGASPWAPVLIGLILSCVALLEAFGSSVEAVPEYVWYVAIGLFAGLSGWISVVRERRKSEQQNRKGSDDVET